MLIVEACLPRFMLYMKGIVTLAPEGVCDGSAFGSVCLSARTRSSKTIATIDLIFLHRKEYSHGQSSSKIIRIWTQQFIKGFFTINCIVFGHRTKYITLTYIMA